VKKNNITVSPLVYRRQHNISNSGYGAKLQRNKVAFIGQSAVYFVIFKKTISAY